MWYLQTDILLRMLLAAGGSALAAAACARWGKQAGIPRLYLLLDLALIFYVSKGLFVFYTGYTLVTYAFVRLLFGMKRFRKTCFVLLCFGCTVPFFYGRGAGLFPQLPMPIVFVGISYNMLKAIDALYYTYYTEERIPFLTYANYLLFFPVITAGPIFRYRDFARCYDAPKFPAAEGVTALTKRLIRGLFKKVVILAWAGLATTRLLAAQRCWYVSLLLLASSYITLYLDMSGYADIAIAVGGFLGIRVPENFKNPLASPSLTQFWRNWHITLSDWIREHIFVVIQGKKLTKVHGAIIGFCTMFLMCLWHGFTLTYVLDGIYLGSILVLENLLGLSMVNKRKVKKSDYLLRCAITTVLFSLSSAFVLYGGRQTIYLLLGLVGR